MIKSSQSITKDFVVLSPDKHATIERCDSGLYERLDKDYGGFKGHDLISCYEFDDDWSSWERHPHGDEVVVLLSGAATFVLQCEDGVKSLHLEQEGAYVIIPKNVWHTVQTGVKTKILFVTPGEGTEHKPLA